MTAAGLPEPVADHAIRAAHMALDRMEALETYNTGSHNKLQMRIGVDTDAVVAGVIGQRKFLYDLWGDVVSTASRMESNGVAEGIQLTDSTRQRLSEAVFKFEARSPIQVKGKGKMRTLFLTGRNGADLRQNIH